MTSNDAGSAGSDPGATPPMNPGDEAPAGTPGTGDKPCSSCGGSGEDDSGKPCEACGGSGLITAGIGGA